MEGETMIKLIIDNHYSRRDMYGNVYWFSVVTSTQTGEQIRFKTPHYSNTNSMGRRAGLEWGEIHETNDTMHPIREFDRITKGMDYNSCMDDRWINEMKRLAGIA